MEGTQGLGTEMTLWRLRGKAVSGLLLPFILWRNTGDGMGEWSHPGILRAGLVPLLRLLLPPQPRSPACPHSGGVPSPCLHPHSLPALPLIPGAVRSPPGLAKTPLSALGLKPHNPADILLHPTGGE